MFWPHCTTSYISYVEGIYYQFSSLSLSITNVFLLAAAAPPPPLPTTQILFTKVMSQEISGK